MNVSDDNDSVKKINALRRELYEDKKKNKYKGGLSLHGNNANGSLKLDIQLFAEKDIKNQKSASLKRAIESPKNR